MIKSMTGFGRGTAAGENFTAIVEMRSVNNRNLDIHWRAPQELAAWEIPLKKQVQAAISRGRVDLTITLMQTGEVGYEVNRPLLRGYLNALRQIREEFGLAGEVDLATIARLPGILQPSSVDKSLDETVVRGVEEALTQALAALVAMRAVEGHELQKELLERIRRIEHQLSIIEANSATITDHYREKMRARMAEILENVSLDETRMAQEIAYLAERTDITEEIARLRSHLPQLRDLISGDGEIGKKLDFLLQETNREANTILSKSADLAICDAAIEIKTEVEKLREQAQNVE